MVFGHERKNIIVRLYGPQRSITAVMGAKLGWWND
jgi:hypothetical protein